MHGVVQHNLCYTNKHKICKEGLFGQVCPIWGYFIIDVLLFTASQLHKVLSKLTWKVCVYMHMMSGLKHM